MVDGFAVKQQAILRAHEFSDSENQANRSVDSVRIKEPSVVRAYFRGGVIVLNGVALWGTAFSRVGVGSYQILGDLAGIAVTDFPIDAFFYSTLIGAGLGASRGILSAVEYGMLQMNILRGLTKSFIDHACPSDEEEALNHCSIQETFGADEMRKWLVQSTPLETYKRYLMPVWHKNNLVTELLHYIEPNLNAVDFVLDHQSAVVPLLDKTLLVSLMYPHIEVALFHLVQTKKRRATFFACTVLCLSTCTLLFTGVLQEHLPVASKFVNIYEQLKEDGVIASNHPLKAYVRDSLVATLGLVVYVTEQYGSVRPSKDIHV